MPPRADVPIPLEETYRELLRACVAKAGGQHAVAAMAGVDQATISRAMRPDGRATYGTLLKLRAAIPELPSPIVPVRDTEHERWCRIGAYLAADKPTVFEHLLKVATEASGVAPVPPGSPMEEQLEKLKSVIANPLPSSRTRKSAG